MELRPGGCLPRSTSAKALGEDWVAWPVREAEGRPGDWRMRNERRRGQGGWREGTAGLMECNGLGGNRSQEETVGHVQFSSVQSLSPV